VQKVRLTGLSSNLTSETVSLDILGNATVSRGSVNRAAKTVTQTVDAPDSTNDAVTVTINGLLTSLTSQTGLETTFVYDALERRTGVSDPRTGTATTAYNAKGQVAWIEDAASNRTAYAYDPDSGRQTRSNALDQVTYTAYDLRKAGSPTSGAPPIPSATRLTILGA
jgi:YD repeat-containing protein